MSAGVCKATIIGNLGRDPDTRYTPEGVMFCSFNLAASRKYTDKSGQLQEKTVWFRVTTWRRLAETMTTLVEKGALIKGRQVYVTGSIEPREYTDQYGQKKFSIDVTADDVQLLGAKPTESPGKEVFAAASTVVAASGADDEFAFAPFPGTGG